MQLATTMVLAITTVAVLLQVASAAWGRQRDAIAVRQDALRRAELAATRLETALGNMQSGARAYLVTGDSAFLAPWTLGRMQLAADMDSLAHLIESESLGQAELRHFAAAAAEWVHHAEPEPGAPRSMTPEPRQAHEAHEAMEARRNARLDHLATDEARMDAARAAQQSLIRTIRQAAEREVHIGVSQRRSSERDALLIRLVAMLATILLVMVVARVLTQTLRSIVRGASALASGDYEGARAASNLGGSREAYRLSREFDRLAYAIAEREQILQSDILQLKELELLKSDFVSTVSHELRTPLTAVRGALGLVLAGATGPLTPRANDLLQIAKQNTQRLIRLINDILDIEKMEGGHLALRMEPCDLAGVLHATIAGVRSVADDARVRLRVNAPERPLVSGDADRLVQVFTNLISNAIKFSPPGREVRLHLATSDSTAIVSVADHGPGIPLEFRDRIFGKFQQAESSETRATGGTGLGLAIARSIVELHGGSIRFESRPGAGTTFIVELPYTPERALVLTRERPDLPYLLIVEPEAATRDVLTERCAPFAEVVAVGSGREAIAAARQVAFDAAIVDPDASGIRGLELVRELRAIAGVGDAPILLYAAREYEAAELAPLGLGPGDAFVKTVHRERALTSRLRAVMVLRTPDARMAFSRD